LDTPINIAMAVAGMRAEVLTVHHEVRLSPMPTAINVRSRDPKARYDGGFDRWDHTAREGWTVLWRASEHADFVLGADENVWVWNEQQHIWNVLPPDEQDIVLREHRLTIKNLRRAIPVMRLFLDGSVTTEREAARAALNRIGTSIAAIWQEGRAEDRLKRGQGWIDHPAALYRAITRDCRHQLKSHPEIPFNPTVFAQLVALAEEDFNAGRRTHPPRLRPSDFAGLQANLEHRMRTAAPVDEVTHDPEMAGLDAGAAEATETQMPEPPPAPRDRSLDLAGLRQVYGSEMDAAEVTAEERKRRRRRVLLGSGAVAACLALVAVLAQFG